MFPRPIHTYTMFLITDCLTSLDPCPLFEKGFDPSRRKEKWSCYFSNYNIRTGNFKVVYELDLIVIRFLEYYDFVDFRDFRECLLPHFFLFTLNRTCLLDAF